MTLPNIFKSVLDPSASQYQDYPTGLRSHKFSENGEGTDYYHYWPPKKPKGKTKSDKKHAILSALTLLAFLFFLNILQSCIREQAQTRGTTMMFVPSAPTAHYAKDPDAVQSSPIEKRSRGSTESESGGKVVSRKARTLLGISAPSGEVTSSAHRHTKFIRNYYNVNNWTRELSQVSEKDLEDQKLKTLNFPLYWKNNRFASTETTEFPALKTPEATFLANKKVPLVLRRIKKRERTRTGPEVLQSENKTVTLNVTAQKMTWDYKNPLARTSQVFQENKYTFGKNNMNFGQVWNYNRTQAAWKAASQNATQTPEQTTTSDAPQTFRNTALTPLSTFLLPNYVVTTPRNRRSEYEDYDPREDAGPPPTTAVGLDLNTYQTFPVYNYYNHRHAANLFRENQTFDAPSPSPEPQTADVDRMHTEPARVTTEPPLFYPTKLALSTLSYPSRHRNRYPVHHGHYHVPARNPVEFRYRYSPYRKAGAHDPHFHEDYVVVAKYPQDEESGFDLLKFFWSMVASFAKPLSNLVPSFAKENNEEPQCYDLLVCEAQRISKFMGPTAEALATTLGTLLSWAATEETRRVVVDALNAGKENTCQQQIRECEDRSGGKSAMTVIAQVMEMKLR